MGDLLLGEEATNKPEESIYLVILLIICFYQPLRMKDIIQLSQFFMRKIT